MPGMPGDDNEGLEGTAPLIRHPEMDAETGHRHKDAHPHAKPATVGSWCSYVFNDLVWSNGLLCSFMAAFLHSIEPIFVKSLPRTSPFVLAVLRSCIALPSTIVLVSRRSSDA